MGRNLDICLKLVLANVIFISITFLLKTRDDSWSDAAELNICGKRVIDKTMFYFYYVSVKDTRLFVVWRGGLVLVNAMFHLKSWDGPLSVWVEFDDCGKLVLDDD